jgi:hypothetical protein
MQRKFEDVQVFAGLAQLAHVFAYPNGEMFG